MECALNTLNVVSQLTVPVARGLHDALSRAGDMAAPLGRLVRDTWVPPGVPFEVALASAIGLSVFTVGYLILRRV